MIRSCVDCADKFETRGPGKYCGPCGLTRRKASDEAYRSRNREKYRQNAKAWAEANPDRVKARRALERATKADVIKQREAARRARDAEKRRQKARQYYWKNRERVLARMSTDEGRRASRDRMRVKMQDPAHRLHSNVSRLIRTSLSGKKDGRSWEDILGYTREDLAAHLERQFTKGMSWENMGEWHVDHIVPRCSFDFTGPTDPEFLACWALTNLRPLWSTENLMKSGIRLHLV